MDMPARNVGGNLVDMLMGGGGGAGRETVLLTFQPSHFIV